MGKLSEMDAVRQELDELDESSVSELALQAQKTIKNKPKQQPTCFKIYPRKTVFDAVSGVILVPKVIPK